MITPQPIGLLNTGLPVLILVAMAVLVPRLLVPAANLSHQALALAVGITALLMLACGAALIAIAYTTSGLDVWGALRTAPAAVAVFFLRQSASATIIWGPILALTWFSMAQGVERRRGEERAKRGSR